VCCKICSELSHLVLWPKFQVAAFQEVMAMGSPAGTFGRCPVVSLPCFQNFFFSPLFACCIYPSLPPPRIAAVLSTNRSWARASFLQAPQTARSSWTSKFTPGSPEKVVPVISCSKNGPGLANGGLQFRDNFLAPFSSGTPLPRAQAGVHFLCECAIFHWPDRQTWLVGLQRPPQIPKSHPISNLQCRCNRSSPVRQSTQSTEPSSS